MKTNHNQPWLPFLTTTALLSVINAEEATPKIKPFDTANYFFGKPYSNTLGYAALSTPDYHLFEEDISIPFISSDPTNAGSEESYKQWGILGDALNKIPDPQKNEVILKDGKITYQEIIQEEFAKRMLNKRLVFATDKDGKNRVDGSAVLLKLRDSFQLYNEAQPGFQVDYTNHSSDGDSLLLKGAIMADIYHPWLYNDNDAFKNTDWIHNPYKIVMRTGVEFNHSDTGTKTDLTSYYLLANFQANPDQDWIIAPQFIQAGIAFDENGVTNESDTRFILSWQPMMYLKEPIFGSIGESLGINVRQYHDRPFGLISATESAKEIEKLGKMARNNKLKGNWYTWMPMDISVSNSSEILESLIADNDFGGAIASLRTGYGIGNDRHGFRFRYEFNADTPLSNLDESRVSHAFIGELAVNMQGNSLQKEPDDDGNVEDVYSSATSTSDTFSGMIIFAKWQTGEFDTTGGDHSELSVGTRWRF